MFPLLLTLVLLVLAASLGSWLFSQWLSEQRRASALAVGLGGMGFVLLLAASAVVILSTTTHWQLWGLPGFDPPVVKKTAAARAVAVADLGTVDDWPATKCIKPLHATATVPRRWFLDNECEQPVVVMLAWCDEARSVCTAGSPEAAWRYETAGIVLASALSRPTLRRMPERDAPISGTYALTEPDGGALRIRYLACYLAEPAIGTLSHDTVGQQEFYRMMMADACYSRVSTASAAAARSGQPPVISFP